MPSIEVYAAALRDFDEEDKAGATGVRRETFG